MVPQNKKTISTNKTTVVAAIQRRKPQQAAPPAEDRLEVKIKLPINVPEVSAKIKAVLDKFK